MNKKNLSILIVALLILVGITFLYSKTEKFCFTFDYNTAFGDRSVSAPSNQGFFGPGGIQYFIPELPALQKILEQEGLWIDPFEKTGGKIYAAAFFGPSTKTALTDFQKKYGITPTGQAGKKTIDKLTELYGCPLSAKENATSTKAVLE